MTIWRRRRRADFFALLYQQAEKVYEGLNYLCQYMNKGKKEAGEMVRDAEKEADEVRRVIVDELNRSFITPIDREDIFALSRAVDDVVDYAKTTVDEMEIYELQPDDFLREMCSVLREAAREIKNGIKHLRDRPRISLDHAVRAKKLENAIEKIYHQALANLFQGEDPVYMLKMRELYRHLSNAADRGDEAANIIGDIVIKME